MRRENAQMNALEILEELASKFPGVIDGDTNVSSDELVKWLTKEIAYKESLSMYLSCYTIDTGFAKAD